MKLRVLNLAPAIRGARSGPLARGSIPTSLNSSTRRSAASLSQRPDSKYVQFPGAVKSAFTTTLKFEQPSSHDAMPTYRAVDQGGNVVDPSFKPDLADEEVIKLYKDMLLISIMDIIMFDSQRQGRISFYMVSSGEEAVCVGSASALTKEDVIFCQYREQGVFAQRGFTPKDFMNQLFANRMDPGKGRNMPVHYGSKELNIVRAIYIHHSLCSCACLQSILPPAIKLTRSSYVAHNLVAIGNTNTPRIRSRVRLENATPAKPCHPTTRGRSLFWRGCRVRG